MALKGLNDKVCSTRDICDRVGKNKQYLWAAVLAVLLDIVMPISYFVALFFLDGLLLLFVEVVLVTIGIVLWILLFREIGFHSLIPLIATIVGIILMITVVLILVGLLIFVVPWFIVSVVWHWWENK